jgi:hypothetical protein
MRRRIINATVAVALVTLAAGTAAAQCIGDANNNGFVNFADYGAVAANFGKPCSPETRFVDNLDGTISDMGNGLMWEKKVALDGEADFSNPHDADNRFHWSGECSPGGIFCQPDGASEGTCNALVEGNAYGCSQCDPSKGTCAVGGLSGETAWQWIVTLNALAFAGHSDWRLPTFAELQTLLSLKGGVYPYCVSSPCTFPEFNGGGCGADCSDISSPSCSCTFPEGYWSASSSTIVQGGTGSAFMVSFQAGGGGSIDKRGGIYSVRAVRDSK